MSIHHLRMASKGHIGKRHCLNRMLHGYLRSVLMQKHRIGLHHLLRERSNHLRVHSEFVLNRKAEVIYWHLLLSDMPIFIASWSI